MADNKLLNQKVKISKNQIVGYSPITRKHINQTMTFKQLCKASMQGDNPATKIANLEPKVNHVSLITNENKTTPKIMARDINKLAFSNAILDIKHRLRFKKWLIVSSTRNNRIAAEVPDKWEVGDKKLALVNMVQQMILLLFGLMIIELS